MAGLADLFSGAGGAAAGSAASEGLGSMFSSAVPYLGSVLDVAQGKYGAAAGAAIGSVFGPIGTFAGGILGGMLDTHGGPKIESGYASQGLDPSTLRLGERADMNPGQNLSRGLQNPTQDKAIVDAITGKYNSILSQYGIKGDPLQLAAFSAFDPKGTAQTQYDLEGFLGGQKIYERANNDQNFENVGRDKDSFMKALQDSANGVLTPALAHYGLKLDPTTGNIDASGIQRPINNTGGNTMAGFDQLAASQAQQQAQAGKTPEEWAQMLANGWTPSNASTFATPSINAAVPSFGGLGIGAGGDTSGGGDLGSILGNLGSGLGNINLGQALSGFLGAQNTKQAGQTMIDFLNNQQNTMQQQGATAHQGLMDYINGQQGKIDGLYNPGTPEANLLQQQMEAKDAAAGRNSQYGTRSVDLAAKLASLKGGLDAQFAGSSIPAVNNSFNQAASNTNSFTQGTSRALSDALTQRANAFPSAIGSTLGGAANGGLGTLAQLLGLGGGGAAGLTGNAGSLINQLFGSGGSGTDGLLNGISNNGFNNTAGGGLSIPSASQVNDIFNNPSFTGVGNTDFLNFPTNDVFGSSDFFNGGNFDFGSGSNFDISDWFDF